MSRKLNQTLAVEKSLKGRAETLFTELHKATQKDDLMEGFNKNYSAVKDGDVGQPAQAKKVQYTSKEVFQTLSEVFTELFNATASKDVANCSAKSDVRVNGAVLLEKVPSTNLLFLDKKLTDLHTFVSKFVELKSDTDWTYDANSGYWKSGELKSQVTAKVQEALMMAPATPQHPAQTQLITRDVVVGHWTTVKLSGALPRPKKLELLKRIQQLQNAVKEALEEANAIESPTVDFGAAVMNHLFASVV